MCLVAQWYLFSAAELGKLDGRALFALIPIPLFLAGVGGFVIWAIVKGIGDVLVHHKRNPSREKKEEKRARLQRGWALTALLIGAIPAAIGLLIFAPRIFSGIPPEMFLFGWWLILLGAVVALVLWLFGLFVTWLIVRRMDE